MNPTLHAQILTLRKYQAWRKGDDTRTIDEAGIVPAAVTSALDAVLEIAEKYLRGNTTVVTCQLYGHPLKTCAECNHELACSAKTVSVPSDDAILDIAVAESLAYRDGTGSIISLWRDDADIREYVLDFAHALLAKYGHNNTCCNNPAQCWEPCGELGNSLDHAAVAPKGVNSIPPLYDETDALTIAYMSGLADGKKHNHVDATCYRLLRSMPQGLKILTQVAPGEWEEILSGDDLDTFLKEYPR